jgi:hypothetical protein
VLAKVGRNSESSDATPEEKYVKTWIVASVILLALIALALWAQSNGDPSEIRISDDAAKRVAGGTAMPASHAGPAKWDASGRFACSVDSATFARTCGFRLVRNEDGKSVDIWVRNLAKNKAEYRVFHYVDETFTSNEDSEVTWQRRGDKWSLSVDGKEFYLIPDALIRAD